VTHGSIHCTERTIAYQVRRSSISKGDCIKTWLNLLQEWTTAY